MRCPQTHAGYTEPVKVWQMIGIGALTTGILALIRRRGPRDEKNVVELEQGTSTQPMAVGSRSQVRDLLDEYGEYLRSQGVNTDWFSPEELTKLKNDGVYAIPPRHLWDEMARTILGVAQPIRERLGAPLRIYNGYRPRWYNEKVGGARNSLHIRNAALDLIPLEYGKRRELAEIAAQFALENGERLRLGMGIYNYPNMTGLHVDALVRNRFTPYAATKKWMAAVEKKAVVA